MPGLRDREGEAMKMSGHETWSVVARYNVASDGILRKFTHGEVAEWPKAAVC